MMRPPPNLSGLVGFDDGVVSLAALCSEHYMRHAGKRAFTIPVHQVGALQRYRTVIRVAGAH